jgi:hypothetical protein
MKLNINITDPLSFPAWDSLILSCPGHSVFHSSAWARVLCEAYHYTPIYFTVIDQDELAALVPLMEIRSLLTGRRGVSLPFSDYCNPIIREGISLYELLDQVIAHGKKYKWDSLELRGGEKYFYNITPSVYYFRHTLNLSQDEEQIFRGFRDSTRRNIKKAISEGVNVQRSNSFESVKAFYQLNCITRKEHGLPPQPFYFFEKIYTHIISKDHGFVVLASYKKNIIAGSIFFHAGDQAMYKYGASDKKFQHLRANNLVMWEAVKWYGKAGYRNFCFGRTEPENQGLRQFKNGWGTREDIIKYYTYDLKNDTFKDKDNGQNNHMFYNKVFKRCPVSALRIVGSLLYRHIG